MGDQQVVVQPVDVLVQGVQLRQEVELLVQGAGIGLDVNVEDLAGLGGIPEEHLTVVHVRPLDHLAVDEDQELGVFPVVPLLDLGADLQPHGLAVHALGDDHIPPEPVVLPGDALEVRGLALELALKLVGAVAGGVPVHVAAVKHLPGGGAGLRLLRAEELAVLVLQVGKLLAVTEPEIAQLVADDLHPLLDEIHKSPSQSVINAIFLFAGQNPRELLRGSGPETDRMSHIPQKSGAVAI